MDIEALRASSLWDILGSGAVHHARESWERSSFGGEIRKFILDVHMEHGVPVSHRNGAVMEAIYVRLWMSEASLG